MWGIWLGSGLPVKPTVGTTTMPVLLPYCPSACSSLICSLLNPPLLLVIDTAQSYQGRVYKGHPVKVAMFPITLLGKDMQMLHMARNMVVGRAHKLAWKDVCVVSGELIHQLVGRWEGASRGL